MRCLRLSKNTDKYEEKIPTNTKKKYRQIRRKNTDQYEEKIHDNILVYTGKKTNKKIRPYIYTLSSGI
jgi:hypothetical protein